MTDEQRLNAHLHAAIVANAISVIKGIDETRLDDKTMLRIVDQTLVIVTAAFSLIGKPGGLERSIQTYKANVAEIASAISGEILPKMKGLSEDELIELVQAELDNRL